MMMMMVNEEKSKLDSYNLGDKVIARWVDGKRYPGQIHQVLTSDSYLVLFEDGLRKVVKVNHIEPNLNPIPRTELPFEDAREQRAIHESDICDLVINCVCGSFEDTGFLIQCDHCLTFQHADCLDVKTDADLLEAITCSSCLNPKGIRESCRYKFDHSWLKDATLPNLVQNLDEPVEVNKRIATVNCLLEAALECASVIYGLRAKIPLKNETIGSSKELKCWSKSWLTTDFQSLPKIRNPTATRVKPITPAKVKGKGSYKKPRSTKKDKIMSKSTGINLDNIDPCSSLNDSNLSSTSADYHQTAIDSINGDPKKHIESADLNKSYTSQVNLSICSPNLDEICQKNLDEHIENINVRLKRYLDYIESRISELEEWYGPDLDEDDIDPSEFRISLENLRSNLETFERVKRLIANHRKLYSNEQSTKRKSKKK